MPETRGGSDHGEFRYVVLQGIVIPDFQKHGARKQAVPRLLSDDPDRQAVFRIRAREAVLHENVAPLQVALQPGQ